jgi:hypothetical protein
MTSSRPGGILDLGPQVSRDVSPLVVRLVLPCMQPRAVHAIALRIDRAEADTGDTEELQQAFVHYRALFDDLPEVEAPAPRETQR